MEASHIDIAKYKDDNEYKLYQIVKLKKNPANL